MESDFGANRFNLRSLSLERIRCITDNAIEVPCDQSIEIAHADTDPKHYLLLFNGIAESEIFSIPAPRSRQSRTPFTEKIFGSFSTTDLQQI